MYSRLCQVVCQCDCVLLLWGCWGVFFLLFFLEKRGPAGRHRQSLRGNMLVRGVRVRARVHVSVVYVWLKSVLFGLGWASANRANPQSTAPLTADHTRFILGPYSTRTLLVLDPYSTRTRPVIRNQSINTQISSNSSMPCRQCPRGLRG